MLFQKMDLKECGLCLDPYTNPKFLPCHHTYCAPCIESLAQSSQKVDGSFPCPACRRTTKLPAGGVKALQTNSFIQTGTDGSAHQGMVQLSIYLTLINLYFCICFLKVFHSFCNMLMCNFYQWNHLLHYLLIMFFFCYFFSFIIIIFINCYGMSILCNK